MKKGCAEGRSPFAGYLRVSLRYKPYPIPSRNGADQMVAKVFGTLLDAVTHLPYGALMTPWR